MPAISNLLLPAIKVCCTCRVKKPLDQFSKNRTMRDGIAVRCKLCVAKHREAVREQVIAHSAEYRKTHKEQIAKHNAEYRKTHKEQRARHSAARYYAKTEQIKAYQIEYAKTHKEKIAIRTANHHKTISGFVTRIWNGINNRTVNGSHPNYKNKISRRYIERGIRLEITRKELKAKVLESWPVISAIWTNGGIPSIDRIDSNGHYSAQNIQFIPLSENCRKSAYETQMKTRAKRLTTQK
jgi:hypothetical protein